MLHKVTIVLCRQLLTVEDVGEVELLAAGHLAGVQVVEVLSVAVVRVPPLAGAGLGVAVVPAVDSGHCTAVLPILQSYHSSSLQGARYRHSSMLELQFWWSAMEL